MGAALGFPNGVFPCADGFVEISGGGGRFPGTVKLFDLIERFADDPALADAVRRRWGVRQPLPLEPARWAEALAGEEDEDEPWDESDGVQAHLLRDLFGNPFRPVALDPSWRTPDVLTLARAAYEERSSPAGTLDPARLAVLADALEEAGCRDPAPLDHLRDGGLHARGCWVVDLLLGKG